MSELLSKIVEPIAFEETGNEVDSTSDMLARIANINEKLSSKKPIIDNIEIPPKINVSQAKMNVSEEKVDISPAMMNVSQEMRKIVEKPNFKQNSSSDKKMYKKGDIRSFMSKQNQLETSSNDDLETKLRERIESLRSKVSKETKIPDIAERMKAGWVTDKLIGDDPFKLPGSKLPESLGSKQMEDGLSIVGAVVRSLFPSLQNVEAARLTRLAVLKSKVQFNDIDYHKALRYISIVGGNELIDRAGLWRVRPIWKGGRPDLITVGGDASRDETNWCDSRHDIMDHERACL